MRLRPCCSQLQLDVGESQLIRRYAEVAQTYVLGDSKIFTVAFAVSKSLGWRRPEISGPINCLVCFPPYALVKELVNRPKLIAGGLQL